MLVHLSTCSRQISFTRLVIIPWCQGKSFCCHVCKLFLLMLCTLIGAIILSINIQVGLNMHPYDDIGDALSSLRGSTSSFYLFFKALLSPFLPRFVTIFAVFCHHFCRVLSPFPPCFVTISAVFCHHFYRVLSPFLPCFVTISAVFCHHFCRVLSPFLPCFVTISAVFCHHFCRVLS